MLALILNSHFPEVDRTRYVYMMVSNVCVPVWCGSITSRTATIKATEDLIHTASPDVRVTLRVYVFYRNDKF